MARNDDVELTLHMHHETDAAYLLSDTGEDDDGAWVPKALVIKIEPVRNDLYNVTMPEWMAIDKEFI